MELLAEHRLSLVAEELRTRAGLMEPPFSTSAIIEACFDDARVTGRDLPPSIDEAVARTPRGPLIIYRRGLPTADQRFAIAHAMAHLLFDGERDACAVGRVGTAACELRADRFAEKLLVPLRKLMEHVRFWPSNGADHETYLDQVDQIAGIFHVPANVIDKRIRELAR